MKNYQRTDQHKEREKNMMAKELLRRYEEKLNQEKDLYKVDLVKQNERERYAHEK